MYNTLLIKKDGRDLNLTDIQTRLFCKFATTCIFVPVPDDGFINMLKHAACYNQ
jgi:hypothetical protein